MIGLHCDKAMSNAVSEVIWFIRSINKLGTKKLQPAYIVTGNQPFIQQKISYLMIELITFKWTIFSQGQSLGRVVATIIFCYNMSNKKVKVFYAFKYNSIVDVIG